MVALSTIEYSFVARGATIVFFECSDSSMFDTKSLIWWSGMTFYTLMRSTIAIPTLCRKRRVLLLLLFLGARRGERANSRN